jgi:hypothetical protein
LRNARLRKAGVGRGIKESARCSNKCLRASGNFWAAIIK